MARTRTEALGQAGASKDFGAVFTPSHIAQFLARWAIRSPSDTVLDPGAGKGVFLFAALERLKELGAPTEAAGQQLFEVELQKEHSERPRENARAHWVLDGVLIFDRAAGRDKHTPRFSVTLLLSAAFLSSAAAAAFRPESLSRTLPPIARLAGESCQSRSPASRRHSS
jgi:hypothetical protein